MRQLAEIHIDPATINGALIAVVAILTFVIGVFQRQAASRTKALEQKEEIYNLKFAKLEELNKIINRITVIETRLEIEQEPVEEQDNG